MPVNAGIYYQRAEEEYRAAETAQEKLQCLKKMMALVPKHKSSENLQREIKEKISRYTKILQKEKQNKKGRKSKFSVKKEGAATVVIVGTTNSGKSTLLSKLTNAKPEIAEYPFTTKKPEMGTMDYCGVKIQMVELPAVFENFEESHDGLALMSIIRLADLTILMFKSKEEEQMLKRELKEVLNNYVVFTRFEDIKDQIWSKLKLVKIYTKIPGGGKQYPPLALKKGNSIKDMAEHIHKDFIKKFNFARVWGDSVKHQGSRVSLDHKLKDNDIVELHMK